MSIATFKPEIWSARLEKNLEKTSTFYGISNRVYEEDADMGDKLHINTITDNIAIKDYTPNSDIDDPQQLATTEEEFELNNHKYFNFQVDDVDRVQARGPLLDRATFFGGRGIAQEIDKFTAGLLNSSTFTSFGINAPRATFNLNFTARVKERVFTRGQNLANMVVVTTPNVVRQVETGVIGGTYGDIIQGEGFRPGEPNAELQSGYYGRVAGLPWFVSNDTTLKTSGANASERMYVIDADYLYLVVQIDKTEAYRPEKRFADAVKGLATYGGMLGGEEADYMRFEWTTVS